MTMRLFITQSPDPPAPPILRPPAWPVGEDEATRLALPHLGWGGGILCGCASPNSNIGAPTAGTPRTLLNHILSGLLNHLIRPLQERRRDRQAEGLGGLEVDNELELLGLLYR